jgi:molybdopterin adenylyltransferase
LCISNPFFASMTSDKQHGDTSAPSYCESFIPPPTLEKLEAGAFRHLVEHLKERSDQVQNIDLMTISGFCRNCLAKWMVVEARRISQQLKTTSLSEQDKSVIQALDALGYDEAAQHVYGMHYNDWKKRYNKKASEEVMEKYNASEPIHAKHDKELLATRAQRPTTPLQVQGGNTTTSPGAALLSNVCCQDPELPALEEHKPRAAAESIPPMIARVVTPQAPSLPTGVLTFTLAILTISDRAASGAYETGDLTGPAVAEAVATVVKELKEQNANSTLSYQIVHQDIVPDAIPDIQNKLKDWCTTTTNVVDLILTAGGTGFANRDVTPEATKDILDQECHGLMAFVTNQCSKLQPLASLSRGTAGVCGSTLIANLPGNPRGAQEIIPVFLPLALHAIADLQKTRKVDPPLMR